MYVYVIGIVDFGKERRRSVCRSMIDPFFLAWSTDSMDFQNDKVPSQK